MNNPVATGHYDAVIVGAGVAGAILALELGKKGRRVLILESGPRDVSLRQDFQKKSIESWIKLPESPYPPYTLDPSNQMAPRASAMAMRNWPKIGDSRAKQQIDKLNKESYLVYPYESRLPFLSGYERLVGGTTWHWLGTSVRLLPNDFRMKSKYGVGSDWSVSYSDLMPDYERAESEIGVSADVDEQTYGGLHFSEGYQYPMPRLPSSYSDQQLAAAVAGVKFLGLPVEVTNAPQGKNSRFANGRPACQGNNSCVPSCPIQAKYDATVTLGRAEDTGNVQILSQCVATKIVIDKDSGRVSSVEYVQYSDDGSASPPQTVTGTVFAIASHAIETPKLLLNSRTDEMPSGVANSSDQVGRNLMDHVVLLSWGLMQSGPVYPYRGSRSGSGIETLRDGPFRKDHAAFRVDIGNEGWGWADNDPFQLTTDLIDGTNGSQLNPQHKKFHGRELIDTLNHYMTRMVRFCFLIEQSAESQNRITLSDHYKDGLGLPRPEINYSLSQYTAEGFVKAQQASDKIFAHAGIKSYTRFVDQRGMPAFEYTDTKGDDHKFNVSGSGHIMGTCRMGIKGQGVVDDKLQTWDHDNLYLLGSSVFPSVGTGNPTLTLAALSFRAADAINRKLDTGK